MFPYFSDCTLLFFLYWIQTCVSMSLLNNNPLFLSNSKTERGISDFIIAKGYIPDDKDLPKPSIIKNVDNDATYLLSKLSDEELIKLLTDQPNKNEYNVKDLVKITTKTKYIPTYNPMLDIGQNSKSKSVANTNDLIENLKKTRFQTISQRDPEKSKPQGAFFRLEHKEVDPFVTNKNKGPTQNTIVQKLNNLLYSRPLETESGNKNEDDDVKKELLFDVLVAQLKTLCCKRNKPVKNNDNSKIKLKALLDDAMPQETTLKSYTSELQASLITTPKEHMFLILNDEIKSNGNDESDLISVDPDSLGKNSSVMLLGPIATPLSDAQLKVVMTRISTELSKPEYLPLLQQISDGTLSNDHLGLVDSLLTGPQTRRYIKPHRCNDQSQLTRVYGGPKWIICTGYLNLNKPSLYD